MQKTKKMPPQALMPAMAPLERPLLPVGMELGSTWSSEGEGEGEGVVAVVEGDSEVTGVSLVV